MLSSSQADLLLLADPLFQPVILTCSESAYNSVVYTVLNPFSSSTAALWSGFYPLQHTYPQSNIFLISGGWQLDLAL